MITIRRNTHEPRLEMLPMIDVIFLLLTFFIYSLVMMSPSKVLPVTLTGVASGQTAKSTAMHWITIDHKGDLFLDKKPLSKSNLSQKLAEIAKDPAQPRLFLAIEAKGDIDRAPLLLHLVEQVRHAGIVHFGIAGMPKKKAATNLP